VSQQLSYLGQKLESLILACPCESRAMPLLGAALAELKAEGRYFERPVASVTQEGEQV